MEPNQFTSYTPVDHSFVPTPVVTPATAVSPESVPPRRSIFKILIWIFGIITALVLVGGVVTFFVLRADPEKVLEQMIAGFSSVKTVELNEEVSIDFTPKNPIKNPAGEMYPGLPKEIKKVSIITQVHQASDLSSPVPLESKSDMRLDTSVILNDERMARMIVASRILDKHIYARLERFDVDLFGFAIEQTKWFDIDTKNKMIAEALAQAPEASADQVKKIREAALTKKFIKIKEDKGIEWFGMVPTHHYTFTLDASEFSSYLGEVATIIGQENVLSTVLPESSSEMQKTIDKIIPSGELWVTVFGQMPYRMRMPFSFDSIIEPLSMFIPELSGASLNLVVTVSADKLNKPIVVAVPEKLMSIEDILNTTMGSLSSARAKGQDAAIKSSLANMRAQAELWYDANGNRYARKSYPFGTCPTVATGNDNLFTDRQMSGLLQSISSAVGITSGMRCMASARAWAAVAVLPSGGSKQDDMVPDAWCVDSTGRSQAYMYSSGASPRTLGDVIDQKAISCLSSSVQPRAPMMAPSLTL
ncbi:MAG: hypothetical protein WAZ40_02105 [Minisyncoccia bacterium]